MKNLSGKLMILILLLIMLAIAVEAGYYIGIAHCMKNIQVKQNYDLNFVTLELDGNEQIVSID